MENSIGNGSGNVRNTGNFFKTSRRFLYNISNNLIMENSEYTINNICIIFIFTRSFKQVKFIYRFRFRDYFSWNFIILKQVSISLYIKLITNFYAVLTYLEQRFPTYGSSPIGSEPHWWVMGQSRFITKIYNLCHLFKKRNNFNSK